MAKRPRHSSSPVGLRRNSRGDRRSNTQPRLPQRELSEEYVRPTGAFGSLRTPKVVGVSDEVRVATKDMARRAMKAERTWERRLSETTEQRLSRESRERQNRAKARRRNGR